MAKLLDHIHVILQIFLRDMKRLVRNPIACVIVAGACVLPALYAWYTIAAFWNPYQNTDDIQVAVVDNDIGASSDLTGKVNIGHEVVEGLSDNHQLGWQFVDETSAMEGIHSGKYYAVIVMPQDFSKSFLSVLDGHFERPQIDFYVNQEMTASGVKVAEAGASAVEKSINEQFVSTVSEKVIEMTQRAGKSILKDSDEANGSLTRGVTEADGTVKTTIEMLDGLGPVMDEASATVADGQQALEDIKGDLPGLESRLLDAQQRLEKVRSSLDAYSASVAAEVTQASLEMGIAASKASAAAGSISGKLQSALGSVNAAINEAERLSDLNTTLLNDLRAAAATNPSLNSAIATLEAQNSSLAATLASLRTLSSSLSSAISSTDAAVQNISSAVESSSAALREATSNIQTQVIPKLNASLDAIAASVGVIRGALISLEPVVEECVLVTGSLQETLSRSKGIVEGTRDSLQGVEDSLQTSLTDLQSLQSSATYKAISEYLGISDDKLASYIASPVDMHTNAIFPVSNYGSGVAPFFTNLALWVAAFILMAIVRIRVDPTGLPKFTRVEAYFGRWLTYIFFGLIQGTIVCIGDLVIGVECVSGPAFVLAGVVTAFVYVNLMYALAYSMRHLGKAIAVFVLIIQIPGSSGMFPVEMMPSFYQWLHPLLPFTYSIDAMREALGGFYDHYFLWDLLILLLIFFPIGLAIGLVVGKYGYNLNILFDRKLGSTELFASEGAADLKPAFRLRTMVKALLNTEQYRSFIIERAKRFDRNYTKLARIGWVALFAMPVLMIVIMSIFKGTPDAKLIMLAWFFVGLLAVAIYLICISFLNSDIEYQMALAQKDDSNLKATVEKAQAEVKAAPQLGDVEDRAPEEAHAANVPIAATASSTEENPSQGEDAS